MRLFNLTDGEFTENITEHRDAVTQVALSHSYLFSLSGSKDTTVKVYDNEMGEIITEFTVRKLLFRIFFDREICLLGSFSTDITYTYIRR